MIEQIEQWASYNPASEAERIILFGQMKKLVPEIAVLLRTQQSNFIDVSEKLRAAEARADEYQNRYESQRQFNVKLEAANRGLICELSKLKTDIAQVARHLSTVLEKTDVEA